MSGDEALWVRHEVRDGAAVVHFGGEIDLANADEVRDALAAAGDGDGCSVVVVDLSQVSYLDSAGLAALDRAQRSLSERGRRCFLVAPAGTTAAWTLRVAAFADGFVHESVASALRR